MKNEKEYFCEHCSHDVTLTELYGCPVCGADLSQLVKGPPLTEISLEITSPECDYVIHDKDNKISLRKIYEDVEKIKEEIKKWNEEQGL